MNYTSPEDLLKHYGNRVMSAISSDLLSESDGFEKALQTAEADQSLVQAKAIVKVNAHIEQASAYINSAISVRYALPITNSDDLKVLQMICRQLVRFTLQDSPNEAVKAAYLAAKDQLQNLAKGKALLTGTSVLNQVGDTIPAKHGKAYYAEYY